MPGFHFLSCLGSFIMETLWEGATLTPGIQGELCAAQPSICSLRPCSRIDPHRRLNVTCLSPRRVTLFSLSVGLASVFIGCLTLSSLMTETYSLRRPFSLQGQSQCILKYILSQQLCAVFSGPGDTFHRLLRQHFVCMEPIYILGVFSCYRDLKTWFVRALRFYTCGEEMWASGKPSGHPSFHQQLPSWLAPLLPVSYLGISSGSEGSIVNTYIPVHHYSQEHFPDSKILVFESS